MAVKVFDVDKDYVDIPYIKGGNARGIIWPGVGARFTSVNLFKMVPGDENVPHVHYHSEDHFYILEGEGFVVDLDSGQRYRIRKGSMVFVEPGTWHTVEVTGDGPYASIGGPCPPDPDMFRRAGLEACLGDDTPIAYQNTFRTLSTLVQLVKQGGSEAGPRLLKKEEIEKVAEAVQRVPQIGESGYKVDLIQDDLIMNTLRNAVSQMGFCTSQNVSMLQAVLVMHGTDQNDGTFKGAEIWGQVKTYAALGCAAFGSLASSMSAEKLPKEIKEVISRSLGLGSGNLTIGLVFIGC